MQQSQLIVPVNHGEGRMIFPESVDFKKLINDGFSLSSETLLKDYKQAIVGSLGFTGTTL